jgi:hypothetical protein
MRPRIDPPVDLLRMAAAQAGVLTREQAMTLGLGRHCIARLLQSGRWQRLAGGLYCTETSEPRWLALAWGGVLLGGSSARLGGAAAAHLAGLLPAAPSGIDVLLTHERIRVDRPPWRFQRERPGVRLGSVGAPPRLRIEDAVLDLCAGATEREVISLVSTAVQKRLTTPARVRERLVARRPVGHRALLLALLADVAKGAETPLELAYLRSVERPHGLPKGERQQHNRTGDWLDVLYRDFRTIVELDGRLGHEGSGRFRDYRRDNRALLAGEVTLRFGWSDVQTNRCGVAMQVREVLRQRGWVGSLSRCRRCSPA